MYVDKSNVKGCFEKTEIDEDVTILKIKITMTVITKKKRRGGKN